MAKSQILWKTLLRYDQEWLDIAPEKASVMMERVNDAGYAIAPDVKKYAAEHPEFRGIAKRMPTYRERGAPGVQPAARLCLLTRILRDQTP